MPYIIIIRMKKIPQLIKQQYWTIQAYFTGLLKARSNGSNAQYEAEFSHGAESETDCYNSGYGMMRLSLLKVRAIMLIAAVSILATACYQSDDLNVDEQDEGDNVTDLDNYIQVNFIDTYDMAIRYLYSDNYLTPGQSVAPSHLDNVIPMLDFIQNFWIDPYLEIENGEEFFRAHVPPEIVFLGGLIYNGDGTVTLGTADAGARITFTNVNAIDNTDIEWRDLQLQTVYHEFAHTVHQNYKLPSAFEDISPQGYTGGGSWFVLTDQDALERGFVSPYSTSSPNEDFAETVAFYLFDAEFYDNFITEEADCQTPECIAGNAGKLMINEKLNAIRQHYIKVTGVDLDELREAVQARL
jgi:substrate import-associated zinc metallohydrolase lipoprotein